MGNLIMGVAAAVIVVGCAAMIIVAYFKGKK